MGRAEFWSLSFPEWKAAAGGFVEFHSGNSKPGGGLTKEEADEIVRRGEETLARQKARLDGGQ